MGLTDVLELICDERRGDEGQQASRTKEGARGRARLEICETEFREVYQDQLERKGF